MPYGYARTRQADDGGADQVHALMAAGVVDVVVERAGSLGAKPLLDGLLATLPAGSVLLVTTADRLAPSLLRLLPLLRAARDRQITLRALDGSLVGDALAALPLDALNAVEALEGALQTARTAPARAVVTRSGRKPVAADKIARALALLARGFTVDAAAGGAGISRSSLYRHLGRGGATALLAADIDRPPRRRRGRITTGTPPA